MNPYDDGWLLDEPREMTSAPAPPVALRCVPHGEAEAVDIAIAHALQFLAPSPPRSSSSSNQEGRT